jgi:ABC-type bacteriocin/lantibiotic exporter with double-glycine peptidase domain
MMLSFTRNAPMTVQEIDHLRDYAGRDGMSVWNLRRLLESGGMPTKAVRVRSADVMMKMPPPQILFWEDNHFLIASRYTRKHVELADPAFGRRRVTWDEFRSSFGNVAIVPEQGLPVTRRRPAAKERYDRFRVRYMLQLSSAKARRSLLAVGLMTVLLDLLAIVTVFLMRSVLLQTGSSVVGTLVAVLLSLSVIEAVGRSARGLIIARTHTAAESYLHTDLFRLMLHQDWRFFARRSKGDLLSRLEFVRELYSKLFNESVLSVFSLVTAVMILGVLTAVSPVASLTVVLMLVGWFGAARFIRRRFVAEATSAVEARVRLGSFAEQVMQGVEGLKGVRGEDAICEMWQVRRAKMAAASRSHRTNSSILDAFLTMASRLSQVVVVALVALAAGREVPAATVFVILSLSGMVITPALAAIRNYISWGELESYIVRFNDLLSRRPISFTRESTSTFQSLSVSGLSFSFGGAKPIIENLRFEIRAGEHLGIWAPSGTGKTTLLRILGGSLESTSGSIEVDGLPLAEATAIGFFCGFVPQEVSLITGTVAENLRVAAPHATDDELWAACALAGIDRELASTPNGLQTRVSANGAGISGGQRQRIAIARALLSQPDVLMLDEATAALDSATEATVIRNLRERTLIVVSHRQELMDMMDRVIYLTPAEIENRH